MTHAHVWALGLVLVTHFVRPPAPMLDSDWLKIEEYILLLAPL